MPGKASFPRSARITRGADYGQVFGSGSRLSSAHLSLRARLRPEQGAQARLGMALSKRNARTAVLRNRIKRMLRDRFRHLRLQLPPVDLVVQLRGPVAMDQCTELAAEFVDLVSRACRRLSRSQPHHSATPADRSSKDAS